MKNCKSEEKIYYELPDILRQYQKLRIAVHLHIFYTDLISEFVEYMGNIPIPFDLFISIPETISVNEQKVRTQFKALANVLTIVIERTPNRGRDIAPILCTFGQVLQGYDVLLHLHTKKTPHDSNKEGWRRYILEHLLGSKDMVGRILTALSDGIGAVCPPDFLFNIPTDGWSHPQNIQEAQKVAERCGLGINLQSDYPSVDFPQGSMLWTRVDYIEKMFKTALQYEDFPPEPIPVDGTIAHALERMFFLWGANSSMKVVKLYHSHSELIFADYARQVYLAYANAMEAKDKQLELSDARNRKYKRWFRLLIWLSVIQTILLVLILTLFILKANI